ncbi:hypothetical protein TNCV_4243081 [Trichonephila clavipes]|nr:hypothetical protein TNCV_4243081 [Trichonephila clavipes]
MPPFRVVPRKRKLNCNGIEPSPPDSISAVMTIVFVCGDPVTTSRNLDSKSLLDEEDGIRYELIQEAFNRFSQTPVAAVALISSVAYDVAHPV